MDGTRVEQASRRLLDRISAGEFAPGAALPPEGVLAAQLGVSRLTLRECVSVLKTQGIVRIAPGRGTFVNARSQWSAGPFIRATTRADSDGTVPLQLLQVRRMIEIGAVELFARTRTDDQLDLMRKQIQLMDAAHADSDIDAFVAADLAFHAVILDGCGNPFVAMLYRPIGRELETARRQTSSVAAVRVNAQRQHRHILQALRSGDPDRSRSAMESHLQQTIDDLVERVLRAAEARPGAATTGTPDHDDNPMT
ncbi:MAG: FadR/GntR family transcriptional regulator [Propionibacterium sp.]|nr:FadR/GntR family transcriptional regulator [Propionibacterium sp.]